MNLVSLALFGGYSLHPIEYVYTLVTNLLSPGLVSGLRVVFLSSVLRIINNVVGNDCWWERVVIGH